MFWKKVTLFLLTAVIFQLNFAVSLAVYVYATESENYTYYIRTETFKSKIVPYKFSDGMIADQFFTVAVKCVPKQLDNKRISDDVYWFAHMNGIWYTDTSDYWDRIAGDKHTRFRFAPVDTKPKDNSILNAFNQYKKDRGAFVRKKVVDLAMKRIGDGYFPGGGLFLRDSEGNGGFNSSWDFIEYIFNKSEIKVDLGSGILQNNIDNFYNEGINISYENLQEGDIVFFKLNNRNTPSDAGIYIGNGNYIYASRAKGKISIGNLSGNNSDHNNMTLITKKYIEKFMKY